MTLGTHAVVGAAMASFLPHHPILAFIGGFLSHFILDSIPHCDYKILSIKDDPDNKLNTDMTLSRAFFFDFLRIGSDAIMGITLALVLFHDYNSLFVLFLGSIGGILPDFLQFVYFKTRSAFLLPLQKFHIFIQSEDVLRGRPILGISLQIILLVVVYFSVEYIMIIWPR